MDLTYLQDIHRIFEWLEKRRRAFRSSPGKIAKLLVATRSLAIFPGEDQRIKLMIFADSACRHAGEGFIFVQTQSVLWAFD